MDAAEVWRVSAYLAAHTGFTATEIRDMAIDDLARWATEVAQWNKRAAP